MNLIKHKYGYTIKTRKGFVSYPTLWLTLWWAFRLTHADMFDAQDLDHYRFSNKIDKSDYKII